MRRCRMTATEWNIMEYGMAKGRGEQREVDGLNDMRTNGACILGK